ncbi:hypothetical protein LCGC14_1696420 [marine sediment metagenome]|uniref:Uncharacterized protein n=1 Tax=marine sediment metagenome TaxID=412755 RepID=A0A0F9JZS3_9ZZZZ
MSKNISYNGGTSQKSCLSGQTVENFLAVCRPRYFFYYLCFQIGAELPCLTAFHADKHAKKQRKHSEYIAFGKGDLQLQATNLAEGQNAQPVN